MAHITTAPAKSDRQYYAATGKRKTAIARVKLITAGTGKVTINDLKIAEYFAGIQIENALSPLVMTSTKEQFDVEAFVLGGGKSGQSDAVRHGISRALLLLNPEFRPQLKAAGYLRRDSRIKERKKPGLKRARRAPQWQKR